MPLGITENEMMRYRALLYASLFVRRKSRHSGKREFVGTGVPDCPRKQRTKGTKEENKKREFVGTPVPTKNNKSPRFTGVFIIG